MAWNSVSKRIAAVFVEAAEEEAKVEELKAGGVARSRGSSGEMDASCMCSPAPSSVFPTDVSTSAGDGMVALSEVASESGNDADYDFDFFSELDDSDDEVFRSPERGFEGLEKGMQNFKGISMKTSVKTVGSGYQTSKVATSKENWRAVGKRLADVISALSISDDEDIPTNNEGLSEANLA
jgi:hypothetical protein